MSDPDAYVALVSSLPRSERLFVAHQPPLSRVRLDNRLSVLSEDHRRKLALVEQLFSWSCYDMDDQVATVLGRVAIALRAVDEPTLRAIISERMEMRTVLAALRMRAAGQEAAPTQIWGYGRWCRHIEANWHEPTFRLERAMPWLQKAAALLQKRDPLMLQRHILDTTFRQLQCHGWHHHFDFEAVALYVLKWNIFDRWSRANTEAAARRFNDLSMAALRNFPDLKLEREAI